MQVFKNLKRKEKILGSVLLGMVLLGGGVVMIKNNQPKIVFIDLKKISSAIVMDKSRFHQGISPEGSSPKGHNPQEGDPQGFKSLRSTPSGFEEEMTKVMKEVVLIKRDFPHKTRFVFEETKEAEDYTEYFLQKLGLLGGGS